jgi:para-nitrobenzyl esterase
MILCGRRTATSILWLALALAAGDTMADPVRTTAGVVAGTAEPDGRGLAFRGIPFAAPPVGDRRWREPQPVAPWPGVRQATAFGPRCEQGPIYDDMVFRDQPSEDCLYLNVWTPARSPAEKRPVMVWIHGGGFQAGSASEPRQDGARLAGKGVVVVSFNYRLGVFGFFAHPSLTKESGRGASGNYGLLDQVAALRWVRDNVAAFGGDPGNVTIFGESAGSLSVSALVASPLARGLFHRAIGESGAYLGRGVLEPMSLAASEEMGSKFAASIGAESLPALRAKPADEILPASLEVQPWFAPTVDGYALPRDPNALYAAGEQAHVPLLAGSNADEVRAGVVLAREKPTAKSFTEQIRSRFGGAAGAVLEVYPAGSDAEALESAAAFAGDMFLSYGTWKWTDVHGRTGGSAVYRYEFDRKIPVAPGTKVDGVPATAADVGACHAGEIEYVFGTLDSRPDVPWEPADRQISERMMAYWSNFARTGDPNGPGLPPWPRYQGPDGFPVMYLDVTSQARPEALRARYEALDAALTGPRRDAPTLPEVSLQALAGTEWVLRAWDVDEPAAAAAEVTLTYGGGVFTGRSGCNRYTAPAKAGDVPGAVTVGPLAVTRMACPELQSAVEARFLGQLRDTRTFGFRLGRLALSYERAGGRRGTMLFDGREPR